MYQIENRAPTGMPADGLHFGTRQAGCRQRIQTALERHGHSVPPGPDETPIEPPTPDKPPAQPPNPKEPPTYPPDPEEPPIDPPPIDDPPIEPPDTPPPMRAGAIAASSFFPTTGSP